VRPFVQADGGDIELLEIAGNSAAVRLTGMCAGCPSAHNGRKGLDRLILGTVSESVARHARCSVEIVRAAPNAA
jgi:NifU-like protein